MPQVVSVRFRYSPKPLWFDPQGESYKPGAGVLVETERGREVGHILNPAIEATSKQVDKLKTPLKPVIRELTDLDYEHLDALEEKGKSAMPYFRERVEHYKLDIKPVEVQYLFSGERAIFYFSSEERVDFRELVRDLAQHFHVRIDMRQIGARDEAKELGGIAHCGEEFCCTRFGGEFQPVSIRMAKEQDLPLNPTKISGVCGRLMCCLRYEVDAYKDFKKRAPKTGTIVDTPLGEAVISGYNTPGETMELKLEDGNRFRVPLAEMDCQKGKEGCTRCSVSHETVERCASRNLQLVLNSMDQRLEDTLEPDAAKKDADLKVNIGSNARRPRRRSTGGKQSSGSEQSSSASARGNKQSSGASARGGEQQKKQQPKTEKSDGARSSDGTSKRRRRRSTAPTGQKQQTQQPAAQKKQKKPTHDSPDNTTSSNSTTNKPRPGQRSSGLRQRSSSNTRGSSQGSSDKNNKQNNTAKAENASSTEQAPQTDTRKRRRRHTSSGTTDSTGNTPSSHE